MDRISPYCFRGPHHKRALEALAALRFATGYEPRNEVIPEKRNVVLGGRAYLDHRVTVPPGSWLWAISGNSQRAEGFTVQIIDIAMKAQLFSAPINVANVTGVGSATDTPGSPLHLLNVARPIVEPAILNVQLHNLSDQTNDVQIVLHVLIPPAAGVPRNSWNAELEAIVDFWRQHTHPGAIQQTTQAGATAAAVAAPALNQVIDGTVAGLNEIVSGVAGYRIGIYEMLLWNGNANPQNVTLKDGLVPLMGTVKAMPGAVGVMLPPADEPHFTLTQGQPFNLDLQLGDVAGFVKYRQLPASAPGGSAQ